MKRGELNDPHRIKSYCLMSIEKMSIEKIDRVSKFMINSFTQKQKPEQWNDGMMGFKHI
jgi:hypothetical protein